MAGATDDGPVDDPALTYEEAHRRFLAVEDDLGLFSARIDGVPFWERARFETHREAIRATTPLGEAHATVGLQRARLRKLRGLLRNVAVGNPFLAEPADIAFVGHPRRKQREDGLWWDVYCDPILEGLDLDAVYLEPDHDHAHHTPAKTGDVRYLDLVKYGGNLRRKFLPPSVLTPADARFLERVEAAFAERFGTGLDVAGRVRRDLVTRRCRRPLYRRLFERLDPDLVVLVVSYGKETAIEVCSDLGIPVVELQHGVINPYHVGYSFPGDRTKETFPDYLFTFGEFWGETVEVPIPGDRVYPVGYPHLEASLSELERDNEGGSGDANGDRSGDESDEGGEQLLVVSQGTIGRELSRFAAALAEGFPGEIVYKLHPGEYDGWADSYPWLREADVDVRADADLYDLFAESAAQIGVYSTALYEGLAVGLDTYLLECPGVVQLKPLVDRGYATVVDSPESFLVAFEAGESSPPEDRTPFFVPNAVDNIEAALADVRERERR
ncbi:hypothetical protein [Saliphagus sp. LR7]|uniref:hypothetical protein n=1 Tax=Saliphagus sp. LR7 TaxID=2282654 RepID=UPI0018E52006|nr:hypothetical protein [Saliphagus sp. LR7]